MDARRRAKEAPGAIDRLHNALPRATNGLARRRSASFSCSNALASVAQPGDDWRDTLRPFAAPCARCRGMTGYRCNRCSGAFYCSRACQRGDWPSHRESCKPPVAGVALYKYVAPAPSSSSLQIESRLGSATAGVLQQASQRSVDADTCSICLLSYARGSGVAPERVPRKLPCAHVFCTECLQQWASRSGPTKCPVCFLVLDEGIDPQEASKRGMVERFPVHFLPDSLDLIAEENALSPNSLDLPTQPNASLATPSPSTAPIALGPKTYQETVYYNNTSGGNNATSTSSSSSQLAAADSEAMASLADMGFDASSARLALAAANGDVGMAVAYLFDPASMPAAPPLSNNHASQSSNSYGSSSYGRGTYSGPVPPPPPMRGLGIAPAGLAIDSDVAYEADDDDEDGDDDCQKRSRWPGQSILKSSPSSPSSTLEELEQHRQALSELVLSEDSPGTSNAAPTPAATAAAPSSNLPVVGPSQAPSAAFTSSDLVSLVEMGFDETEARNALVTAKYKLNGALAILTGQEDDFEGSDDDDLPDLYTRDAGGSTSSSSVGSGSSSCSSDSSSDSSASSSSSSTNGINSTTATTTTTTTSKSANGDLVRRSWPAHVQVGDRVEARDNAGAGSKSSASEVEQWWTGFVSEFGHVDGPKVMHLACCFIWLSIALHLCCRSWCFWLLGNGHFFCLLPLLFFFLSFTQVTP